MRWERDTVEFNVRAERLLAGKRERCEAAEDAHWKSAAHFRILERGYAIAYDASGKVLRSPDQVALSEDISFA